MSNTEGSFTGRRKSREDAFLLIFEKSFAPEEMSEIIENAREARELDADEFTVKLAYGAYEKLTEIDGQIENFSIGWKISRLSRVVLSILRLAVYEILFLSDEVPCGVSINEAVELAKKYGSADDPAFINGVLGSMARRLDGKKNGAVN